jgi:hypothetical protein
MWLSGILQSKGKLAPVHTFKAYRKGRWIAYTRSPSVPHLPRLAVCHRWKFLRDTVVVHQIHTVFTVCLCIYLYLRCKVYSYPANHTKIIFSQQKKSNSHFSPEIITFVFISWPPCTPPHSLSSLTRLLASVTQFRWLPLTFFSV